MTHSPNNHRKKRANEYDDFDHMQFTKKARTKSFEGTEIEDSKYISYVPQSSNHNFSPVSDDKREQFNHQSSFPTNNEFHRSIADNNIQSEIAYVSQEHSSFSPTNFKYLPDLNAIENPHYYENNRLLFELYVERLRRSASHSANTSHQF